MSRAANGVSRRHGEVAREMWQSLWPELPVDQVPIGYVTNGVHVPTWIGAPIRELLDRHLGEGWMTRAAEPDTWAAVDQISDEELWAARERQRTDLVEQVRARSATDRLLRGDARDYVDAAATAFDPHTLTIGFARRVATYKRLDLLYPRPRVDARLLDGDRPCRWCSPVRPTRVTRRPSGPCRACSGSRRPRSSASAWCSSTTTTWPPAPRSCAAATCGSTCRVRRSRPAARAG